MESLLRITVFVSILLKVTTAWAVNYKVVILNPSGASESHAYGISDGQVVGMAFGGSHPNYWGHALIWLGEPDNFVDLHPDGYTYSAANVILDNQQVGRDSIPGARHALLWYGTAESVVDLNPEGYNYSEAYGVSGEQQVGTGLFSDPSDGKLHQHALLWSGFAESVIDLNPEGFQGSEARGISDGQQVGWGIWSNDTNTNRALLWSGSAENYIDLTPNGFSWSRAYAISGNQQGGYALYDAAGEHHALVWQGTAENYIDLHPSTGFDHTGVFCISGNMSWHVVQVENFSSILCEVPDHKRICVHLLRRTLA